MRTGSLPADCFLQWEDITSMRLSLLPCNELENLRNSPGNDLGEQKNTAKYDNMGSFLELKGERTGGFGGLLEVLEVWRVRGPR